MMRAMKTAFLLLTLALAVPAQDAPKQERKTGKAARVNDTVITWDEVYLKFKTFKPSDITEELLRVELRKLVEEQLFLQKARELKIAVTEREVDEAVERVVRAYRGKESFEQYLRWMKMTPTEHRELRRKDLLEIKLYRHLIQAGMKGDATLLVEMIAPDDVRAYYNAHRERFKPIQHCSVFRIGLQWRTEEERKFKRRLAESLRRKIEEGTDMYLVAQYHSDIRVQENGKSDFVVRELKRDNTFFSPETTRYLFETLSVQTLSPVREDGQSFNLFYVLDRINRPEESFEEAQVKIRSELEHKKREENRSKLRGELLKKAYVEPPDLFP